MPTPFIWQWSLDGWIVLAGALCAVSAALLGNFLVLRRMSLLGDAISHAVLPGLAAAFLLTGSRSSWPMFIGAVVVGLLTAMFTQWIRNVGRVDESASMGVVFTSLFALGLLMIVRAADHVDLDPGCVLYGAIEFSPFDPWLVFGLAIPRVVVILSIVLLINASFVLLFYKELKISAFDPALSTTLGISASLMHYLLMILVAVTAVASFESVGNVLVVAMFIVPGATALMMTHRLSTMIWISVCVAVAAAVLGHGMAITVPRLFGFQSTSTAGMMAVAVGGLFALATVFGQQQGLVPKWLRNRRLARKILWEDVIGLLYRAKEKMSQASMSLNEMQQNLQARRWLLGRVVRRLVADGLVARNPEGYELTATGESKAQEIVRSHRLWEQYLVAEAEMPVDRIHVYAESLEHFTGRRLRDQLTNQVSSATIDPHGSPIPPEADEADSEK